MYKLVYNYKESEKDKVLIEKDYFFGDTFRLKKNAIHFLNECIQSEYRKMEYATELITSSSLYCYKSEITAEGNRKVTEWVITIKKI